MCDTHYRQVRRTDSLYPVGKWVVRDGLKWCKECSRYVPVEDFHAWKGAKASRHGLQSYCKPCSNRLRSSYVHGLGRYGLRELLERAGGRCEICAALMEKPCIDHDHKCCPKASSCGKCVRGVLCTKCNVLLGMASDRPEVLRKAQDYLNAKALD
ncbi:endonuclease domain-containing protein [Streptomyces sp. NPDC002790]|uniref:endonuclease domain-containing protein n=1 Tax=Streptomyces sp. NPDC002790 TaxID=3154431 RepID=UPI00331A1A8F